MQPVRKLIQGGEQWLPFALSRLRALSSIGMLWASQRFTMPDGAEVSVSLENGRQVLHIKGGGPYYEFWTSEHVMQGGLHSPGYGPPITAYPYVIGSAVGAQFGSAAKPIYSTALAPPAPEGDDTPKWVLRPYNYETPVAVSGMFRTFGSWQVQRFFEYACWPSNSSSAVVISAQVKPPGWNSNLNLKSSRVGSRLSNSGIFQADVGLDVRPMHYSKVGARTGAPAFPQPWIWFRRAATQVAGGRMFFIHTDNVGRFQVYPASAVNARLRDDLLTPAEYKTYTPPYPDWVTVPDPANYENQQRDWLWTFNADGTKAVSCPFHTTRGPFFKSLEPAYMYATLTAADVAEVNVPSGSIVQSFEDTPGLVEFGIEIEVTGDGDMDYEVTFTLLRSDYFAETGRFIFDAAYALPFKGKNGLTRPPVVPEEDALLTAELQCFTPTASDYTRGPITADNLMGNEWLQDRAVGATADWVLCVNDGEMIATDLFRTRALGPIKFQFLTDDGFAERKAGNPLLAPYVPILSIGSQMPLSAGGTKVYVNNGAVAYDDGEPNAGNLVTGWLRSLELRTLSTFVDESDYGTGTGKLTLRHYNQTVVERINEFNSSAPGIERVLGGVPIPPEGLNCYMHMFTQALDTLSGQGFTVHPAGHWSHCVSGPLHEAPLLDGLFDIVQPYKGKRTSHKALFNTAFEQNRDYSFYREAFPGKTNWDMGSFRTAGVWLTF